jgi:hypothetical protein
MYRRISGARICFGRAAALRRFARLKTSGLPD